MFRRQFLPAVLVAGCLLAPASPAAAGAPPHALHPSAFAAATAKPAPLPTIKRVQPLKLAIGAKLTITGRNFIPGKRRDTVVFLRDGAPAIFLRADTATKTRLTLQLTSKLGKFLVGLNNGQKGPTRFRLRILAKRFGASFTPRKLSPTILPKKPKGDGNQTGPSAPTCTLASAKAAPNADADGDGLTNAREALIKTDPCNADTDGDGIPDGYEFESALDLNSRALPYPGKRPYPNPLDPSDANTDYDGDGLTMADEHAAWVKYGGSRFPLNYSDGTQTTGGPVQVTPQTAWEDIDGNGFLTDDEKDVDGDGLTNWDEAHGRMTPQWWKDAWNTEPSYTLSFQQTDWLDPDTDGDTLPDGADDVDHDGYSNASEVLRDAVLNPYWVQPFNPCLPDPASPTCEKHPPFTNVYPPFRTGDMVPGELLPLVWPR
jgi:hypothetical protein